VPGTDERCPGRAYAALAAAVALAREFDALLRLIAVAPTIEKLIPGRIARTQPGYARAMRAHFAERLEEAVDSVPAGVEAHSVLLEGDPAAELANQGVELELLVLGSRGYGPLRRVLLGGVSQSLMGLAPCPVIVLPRSAAGDREDEVGNRGAQEAPA
jgi:nucleotide-binding universal stress UspA family protein